MAPKSKLLAALDAHRGRDIQAERQKKLRKQAEKKRKGKQQHLQEEEQGIEKTGDGENHKEPGGSKIGEESADGLPEQEVNGDQWETEESEDEDEGGSAARPDISGILDSESDSDSEGAEDGKIQQRHTTNGDLNEDMPSENVDDDDDDDNEDIPLSDLESLASEEKADVLPHQRLTINNTSALLKSLKSIALPWSSLPFSEHQSITSATPVTIASVDDDLNRELAFYKQSLDAVKQARSLLKKEGVPFSRPTDYFAEMVKSDEHMGKIKQKLTDEAANKKAAAEARKQRDLKKFGKAVQVAKLQERDRQKRETMDKINILKRKRRDADTGKAEEDDLFDVALEDASKSDRKSASRNAGGGKRSGPPGKGDNKRQKRNEKFGFGGKKRFSKSGDAVSSADLTGFSARKMKGQSSSKKKGPQRPGKSRRAKMS